MAKYEDIDKNVHIYCGDAFDFYKDWKVPTVIMCDGPYGINGYPGDLLSVDGLSEWYEKHVVEWNMYATPKTTLWFWNTEQGWATVHPMLVRLGWEFKACHVWNKGMSHVAGNTNTNGYKFQEDKSDILQAARVVRAWGAEQLFYDPDATYQNMLKVLQGQFVYRQDTNYAKIDRIEHVDIEAFKAKVENSIFHGKTVKEWSRLLSGKVSDEMLKREIEKII